MRDDALQFHECQKDAYQEDNLAKDPPEHLKATAAELKERVVQWHRHTPWFENPNRYLGVQQRVRARGGNAALEVSRYRIVGLVSS